MSGRRLTRYEFLRAWRPAPARVEAEAHRCREFFVRDFDEHEGEHDREDNRETGSGDARPREPSEHQRT